MNKTTFTAPLERVLDALRALGLKVEPRQPPRALHADGRVRIGPRGRATDYLIMVRPTVTPATIGAVLNRLRTLAKDARQPTLLATAYLTPPMADALRAERQPFADTAGNAYLEGPGLLVFVTGRRPAASARRTDPSVAFTATGLKVLFALLCRPELAAAPQREIAAAAGVALGAVPGAMRALREAGHLLVAGRNVRLHATRRLVDEWALAYAHRLRPRTGLGIYTGPHLATWKDWPFDPRQARWGGEPAAHLLVRYLEPGVLTLYAEKLPPKLMIAQRLVPARPLEAPPYLELRKPFWGTTLQEGARAATVPPVLVYADLLATGDGRCIETAAQLYERCLAGPLAAH